MAQNSDISIWRRFLELCIPYYGIKRRGEDVRPSHTRDEVVLRRALPAWQIVMIAIGGVIGVTIFSTHGEILRLAGPGGLLVATVFVALTMICVMECIGELVMLWPVSNAVVEYVRVFVDEDWAIICGIAYWYAFSCIFATLIVLAANFARYTIDSDVSRGILFYAVVPVGLIVINALGVEYYGFVEGVGGLIKLLMIFSGIIFMIVEAPKAGTNNLDVGFQNQDGVAGNKFQAVCIAITILSYGYIATEMFAATAFEAIDRTNLRFPARAIAYIVALLYLISALLQSFLVSSSEQMLENIGAHQSPSKRSNSSEIEFYPVIVIAANTYSTHTVSTYFNGCVIFFCISAANTALYVASRTLFGLTRHLTHETTRHFPLNILRYFGTITPVRQVPLFALIFSAIAFYWLVPFQLRRGVEISDLLVVMGSTASVGVIIVWASECLAFMRYYCWLRKFREVTSESQTILPPEYNRWQPQPDRYPWHAHRMLLADLRLIPAIFGFIGCFCIVFVLSTAIWWHDGDVTIKRLATAYAGPIILCFIFTVLKLWNRRWWVTLPTDLEELVEITGNLERSSNLRRDTLVSAEATEVGLDYEEGTQSLSDPNTREK